MFSFVQDVISENELKLFGSVEKLITLSEDYRYISPKYLAKILLDMPVDPISKFLERADRELSENMDTFTSL